MYSVEYVHKCVLRMLYPFARGQLDHVEILRDDKLLHQLTVVGNAEGDGVESHHDLTEICTAPPLEPQFVSFHQLDIDVLVSEEPASM